MATFLDEMLKTARAAEARKPDKDLVYMTERFPGAQRREMRIAGLEADRLLQEAARESRKDGIKLPARREIRPDRPEHAPIRGSNAGVMGRAGTPEPAAVWADPKAAPVLAKARGWQTNPGCWLGKAAIIRD